MVGSYFGLENLAEVFNVTKGEGNVVGGEETEKFCDDAHGGIMASVFNSILVYKRMSDALRKLDEQDLVKLYLLTTIILKGN